MKKPNRQKRRDNATRSTLALCLNPYRCVLRFALMMAIITALLMIAQHALLAALFAGWMSFAVNGSGDYSALLWTLLPWIMACLILRAVIEHWRNTMLLRTSLRVRSDLRVQLLNALAELGPARRYFGSDGSLSALLLEQVDALDGYISRYYIQQQIVVIVPLLVIAATYYYSPLAAILLLLTAPLVPIFMIFVGHAAAQKNREQLKALAQLSGRFLDLARGMATLQRLEAHHQAQQSIDAAAQDYQRRTMSVLKLAFLSTAVLELFASLAIALVAVYLGLGLLGILPWAKGIIPVPYQGALFILLLAPEFFQPLRQLGSDYHDKAKAEAAITALIPLLTYQNSATGTSVIDAQHPPSLTLDQVSVTSIQGRTCLAETNLSLLAGERVILSGESGVGKSTILQALLGFRPYHGTISINEQNLTDIDRQSWLAQIGYLAQQPPLMAMSIAANLRLAAPNATDEQLLHVIEQVGMAEVIAHLPDAMHTVLGEHGTGLSGGQSQRLAIAQLLLRNVSLWLLDEPTAHLDPQSSHDILTLLGQVSAGKTVLLVSHDYSSIDWAVRHITLEAHHAKITP